MYILKRDLDAVRVIQRNRILSGHVGGIDGVGLAWLCLPVQIDIHFRVLGIACVHMADLYLQGAEVAVGVKHGRRFSPHLHNGLGG